MPLLLPPMRDFDLGIALALIASMAIASRVRLYIGAGSAVPTQLVLVPMLFLLPPAAVPACVAAGLVAAELFDILRRQAHPERVLTSTADAWYAVGPEPRVRGGRRAAARHRLLGRSDDGADRPVRQRPADRDGPRVARPRHRRASSCA